MWRFIRRAWREFWCKHWNTQKLWHDDNGWYIKVCSRCNRAVIFTGDDETHNKHKMNLG